MSTFTFACPHCGQSLEGTSDLYGQTVDCPQCSGHIEIAAPEKPRLTLRVAPPETPPLQMQSAPRSPSRTQGQVRPQYGNDTRLELWNPNVAANLSLLFSPAFGAWIHASNWRALGNDSKAAVNMGWFWTTIVFLAVNLASIVMPALNLIEGILYLASFTILIAWYFGVAKSQMNYVNKTLGGEYSKKSWGKPFGVGVLLFIGYLGLAMILGVAGYKPSPAQLADEVKPLISTEWQKSPELQNASIQSVTLVHKGGKVYDGFLDATIDGEKLRLSLEVTYDNDTIMWQIKQ